jgi:hypothetical protein
MKRNLILSIIFALLLFTSCYDNSLQPCKRSPFKIVLSDSTTIDGGVFFIQTSHRENPSNVDVQVDLFYQDWKGIVPIKLDSFEINDYDVRLNINPCTSHIWYVTAKPELGIPSIEKTIPGMEPFDITSHNWYDTISSNGTITWSTPSDSSNTDIFIFISNYKFLPRDTTILSAGLMFKTLDNGSYTFSPSVFSNLGIRSGDTIHIILDRVWRDIEKIDGKNYLFVNLFTNGILLVLR